MRRMAIIGAGSIGMVAAAAALRSAGLGDVVVIEDDHADRFTFDPLEYRPQRAPKRERRRPHYNGALGMVLNSEPALATYTSEKPLTKRQRRRLRGKARS